MKKTNSLREALDSVRSSQPYRVEGLILGITEQIAARMEAMGLTKKALADRLKTSPAYVTKFLAGGTNFTVETMVKIADATETEVRVSFVPKTPLTDWYDMMGKTSGVQMGHCLVHSHWTRTQADETNRLIRFYPSSVNRADENWLEECP